MISAAAIAVIVATGIFWLWGELESISNEKTQRLAQTICTLVLVVGLGGLFYWIMNKHRIVDFMIATEAEMRKVNWPTRKEIIGSTWVVICGTLLMALTLFLTDIAFGWLFTHIKVLGTG